MNAAPKFNTAKLKKAIIENTGEGGRFSRRKLSLLASDGKNPDLVRDFLSRGQDRRPTMEFVSGLATALEMSVSDFVIGDVQPSSIMEITVIGAVEAGAWRQADHWDEDLQYSRRVLPTEYDEAGRFGLEVVGLSMDKLFLPGMVLDCIKVPNHIGLHPLPGDVVIAERRMGDLIETTCKRLEQLADGNYQLVAESTRPEFSEPIPIGKPNSEHFDDNETKIIGIVNAAIQQHLRRGG